MQQIFTGRQRLEFDQRPDDISEADLVRYFTVSDELKRAIAKRRGEHNRLGFALQWCWLEYLGWQPSELGRPQDRVTRFVADQLGCDAGVLNEYAPEKSHWYQHQQEVRTGTGWKNLEGRRKTQLAMRLQHLAQDNVDRQQLLVSAVTWSREARIIRPGLTILERLVATAVSSAQERFDSDIVEALPKSLRGAILSAVENLIAGTPVGRNAPDLQQLKAPPGAPSQNNLNRLLDNIEFMAGLGIGKIDLSHLPARRRQEFVKDAMRMSPADLHDRSKPRRVAMVICLLASLWTSHHNYAAEMHRRVLSESRQRAEGRRRNSVVSRLGDIFRYLRMLSAIFKIVKDKTMSDRAKIAAIIALTGGLDDMDVIGRDCDDIAKPGADSKIQHLSNKYSYLRRFAPRFVNIVDFAASSTSKAAAAVMDAVKHLREVDAGRREFDEDPPTGFLSGKMVDEIRQPDGRIDRRTWELAAHEQLAEMVESGAISVVASTQHRGLDADLLATQDDRAALIARRPLLSSFEVFKKAKTEQFYETLERVDDVILEQPGVRIEGHRIHIARLGAVDKPSDTERFKSQMYGLIPFRKLPQVMRITHNWIDYLAPARRLAAGDMRTKNFDDIALAAIYGEAVNLGPDRLSSSTPGITYMQLARVIGRCLTWDVLQQTHARIFKRFNQLDIVKEWGSEEWSASDGMLIPIQMKAFLGRLNPKGQRNQKQINLMTWLCARLMSYSFWVVPTTSVEGRYEFDGIFNHPTGFMPLKHTTDTAGYSDILFGTAAPFGIFYVPIIRDFSSLVFYFLDPADRVRFRNLAPVLRARASFDPVKQAWSKIMDYAATIDARRTPPSQMIAKMQLLGSSSDLAVGIEALGRIEKTIVGLSFAGFESLRREALIMHNKQESYNSLKAAILFGNKGAYRLSADQAIQNRHACLEILASQIIWHNAVHLDAAWKMMQRQGHTITPQHIQHIYPTGTSRINWIGDLNFADARDLRFPIDRVKLLKPKP